MSRILVSLSTFVPAACASADATRPFAVEAIAEFDEPWAMAFLPDGRLLIVDRSGGKSQPASGVPEVDYGGLGDVALHPDLAAHRLV